ncbi:hypothetical protein ACR3K2_09820 [Cryptosporidium serpentis]
MDDFLNRALNIKGDIGDEDDFVQLKFYILSNKEITLEDLSLYCIDIYNVILKEGMMNYNWDTVPFILNTESGNGVNYITCSITINAYYLDEWYMIYMAYFISEKISNIAVQVIDSDGDPLIVEICDVLPSWVNPDCELNRCFIYQGKLHLIPPKILECSRDIELSLGILKNNRGGCEINEAFDSVLKKKFNKISNFSIPEKAHHFHILIPKIVANVLHKYHYLLSLTLRYLPYSSDMPTLRQFKMSSALLNIPDCLCSSELVRYRIRMTRTQYARFVHEILPMKLPMEFTNKFGSKSAIKDYNSENNIEVQRGMRICYGLYLAYLNNPKDFQGILIWANPSNKFSDKESEIFFSNLDFVKKHESLDYRGIWDIITSDEGLLKSSEYFWDTSKGIDDLDEWFYSSCAQDLLKEIEGLHSIDHLINLDNKKRNSCLNITRIMERKSQFEGIDLSTDSDNSSLELSDSEVDEQISELRSLMNKMDDELRISLKSKSIPGFMSNKEIDEAVKNTLEEAIDMENKFGLVGPATTLSYANINENKEH